MNLDDLARTLPGFDWSLALVYLRIQAMILALPGFGERVLPVRVKVAIAMALSPLMTELAPAATMPETPQAILAAALPEIVIGFAAGTLLRIIAIAMDMAATAIAMTASLAQLIGGTGDSAPHPIGNMLHLGGLAVLFALGLPAMLVDLIADTFVIWPSGGLPDIATLAPAAAGFVAQSFGLAMLLAAPFILGGLLFQALSGVINRVMPALPVVFIGAPAAILLALVALALFVPMIVSLWADAVLSFTLPRP
ncbi:flagellar biosynthetic protein FliR [Paracoccus sp. TK19116]|uniref:Flagellar biosynthetic protein FliR n=1 Tax=Paracoccus albicereus TaxID=2922394 RepID=A0ABT1MRW7_9RHOB|nr:flagellar biosynthetic protein FliR [Paracoccus albicereus]MCQ0971055.1 flagellar biosynthetic protein FliR [Paracoccus albicereus]